MKYFVIIVMVLFFGVIVAGAFVYQRADYTEKSVMRPVPLEMNGEVPPDVAAVDVMNDFGDKWVYTTDTSLPEKPFIAHCAYGGGEFNPCGTLCPSDAELCVDVCAYTCENL